MNKLRAELDRFFGWCGLTELEYRLGYRPRIAHVIFEGWEESLYPFWEEMDRAFVQMLAKGNRANIHEIALALSVDWEAGSLQEKLLGSAYDNKPHVYAQLITNPGPTTLSPFQEALVGPFSDVSRELLPLYIISEKRSFCAQIALQLLVKVDHIGAIRTAERMVAHPDLAMIMFSLKILFDHDSEAYHRAGTLFKKGFLGSFSAEAESVGLPRSFWDPESK